MAASEIKQRIVVLIIYALSAGAILLHAQDGSMREVGRRDWAQALPEGEGKGLVLASCTQCHSLNSTVRQRKSAAEWERTVRDMVARGAQIQSPEIPIIATYLARSFPPGAPPLAASSERAAAPRASAKTENAAGALPEGAAKALILRACVECHGLDRITAQRKDEAGWRASVKDMIRLGAKLRPEGETAMVAYLVQHFGRQSLPALSASSSEPVGAKGPADPAQLLPDGEGKGLILASCVQCHNLRPVLAQRKTAEDWKRTVYDMVARGTQITWAEAELIAAYLARHLPREKSEK
jgi:mono/diheme cytochrome c family protein